MKKDSLLLSTCLLLVMAVSCSDQKEQPGIVSVDDVRMYTEELSRDAYLGRKPFTEGETRTIAFIRDELQEAGLTPGNGDSYYQEVPLVEIAGSPDPELHITGSGRDIALQLHTDYVIYTEREQDSVEVSASELVFCGFGIVAPEYSWDDYRGMDMHGKTAVVLVNDPGYGSNEALFKGDTMTYYGRWTYKYEEAERQGAEAIMIIHETASAGYPWYVVQSGWTGGKQQLQSSDGNLTKPAMQGWLTLDAAKKLFEAAGMDLGQQIRTARTPGFTPIPMGLLMSTSLTNTFKRGVSHNVIARLPGSERPEETNVYTAHWDHFGVGAPVDGDSIFNGAVDNATGVAAIMAIAKAFTRLDQQPQRSLVFLFVTAEEQGLLGSEWYAEHPVYPLEKTVTNLNIDALYPFGEFNDLSIRGYGQSDLDDYARDAAKAQGRYVVPDTEPHKGYFFRSDHFNFAKAGVPALYAKIGADNRARGEEYGHQQEEDYRTQRYHQPSDEYDASWDFGGIMQDAQLYFDIGLRIANESSFPQWKVGSEFKGSKPRGSNE